MPSPVASPLTGSVVRRKRARAEDEGEPAGGAEPKRRPPAGATTRARSAEPSEPPSKPSEPAKRLESSPSDVAELEPLRRPSRARGSVVLPSLSDHEEEEREEAIHRPVTRASSKKTKEDEAQRKKTEDEGARGIVRSTRRRVRAAGSSPASRELFRLPTLADLTRVTRSSSRRKPPRPVPAARRVGVRGGWDSGEETEREDEVPDASTPEPAAVAREVRVEAVVDAVFECSDACLCGGAGGQDDEGCDDRCAAYSPLPFPGFSPPPLCADGDELAAGFFAFEAA